VWGWRFDNYDVGGMQAQVLLTKVDKRDESISVDSANIYDSAEVLGMRRSLATKSMLEEKQIHPHINYTGDYGDKRDVVVEYLALSTLWRAIRQAEGFVSGKYTYELAKQEKSMKKNNNRNQSSSRDENSKKQKRSKNSYLRKKKSRKLADADSNSSDDGINNTSKHSNQNRKRYRKRNIHSDDSPYGAVNEKERHSKKPKKEHKSVHKRKLTNKEKEEES